jgi:hypothetical protein
MFVSRNDEVPFPVRDFVITLGLEICDCTTFISALIGYILSLVVFLPSFSTKKIFNISNKISYFQINCLTYFEQSLMVRFNSLQLPQLMDKYGLRVL